MRSRSKAVLIDLAEARSLTNLTRHVWGSWVEAAAVCFERFHNAPPPACSCTVKPVGRDDVPVGLSWPETDDNVRASHANELNATEHGAYAVVCATVGKLDGWRVLGRAHHGSGADLVMVPTDEEDSEAFVRLEVSGILRGKGDAGVSALRGRLRQKVDQLGEGDLDRPGVAAVVGFEVATVLISEVQD